MNKIVIIAVISFFASWNCSGQNLQWSSDEEQSAHSLYASLGYEFGLVSRLGYGRHINASIPIAVAVDYSMPMGKGVMDDFQLRLGAELKLYQKKAFLVSGWSYFSFKRYETALVHISSIGADIGLNLSHVRGPWTFSVQYMRTTSIASKLKHGSVMKDSYPAIRDGWYGATSAQSMYGGRVNRAFANGFSLSFDMGSTNARRQDIDALLPYYTRIVLSKTF